MKNIRTLYFLVILFFVLFSNQERISILLLCCFIGVIYINKDALIGTYEQDIRELVDLYDTYLLYSKLNVLRLAKEYTLLSGYLDTYISVITRLYIATRIYNTRQSYNTKALLLTHRNILSATNLLCI